MHRVLPLRTAPSQMMACRSRSGEPGSHQVSTRRCLGENTISSTVYSPFSSMARRKRSTCPSPLLDACDHSGEEQVDRFLRAMEEKEG